MSQSNIAAATEDLPTVHLYQGDAAWHDGPGWYYVIEEYPEEGSCGAFETEEAVREHARLAGYQVAGILTYKPPQPKK